MSSLNEYLEKYALVAMEKQQKLESLLGDHARELDLDARVVRFSGYFPGTLEFPFQILGTESDNTLNWLWAWADEQTEIPDGLLSSSLQMKEWGRSAGIPECTSPSVDLGTADGRILSMIAVEVCKASCYYRDDYEGGALFLLVFGQEIERQPSFDADGLSRRILDLASMHDMNHKKALISYLELKGLSFTQEGTAVSGMLESGDEIDAEFDNSGRLVSINGETAPAL